MFLPSKARVGGPGPRLAVSSFRRDVRAELLPGDWAGDLSAEGDFGVLRKSPMPAVSLCGERWRQLPGCWVALLLPPPLYQDAENPATARKANDQLRALMVEADAVLAQEVAPSGTLCLWLALVGY